MTNAEHFVPDNYLKSLSGITSMAERGHIGCQIFLAELYIKGDGVPLDYHQAIYWLSKAAERGDDWGSYNLGVMYATGKGVSQDYNQAKIWFAKAAEHGMAPAQYNLGAMYARGLGVPVDYIMAFMWIELAANELNIALKYLPTIEAEMTTKQIAEAKRLSNIWKLKYPNKYHFCPKPVPDNRGE